MADSPGRPIMVDTPRDSPSSVIMQSNKYPVTVPISQESTRSERIKSRLKRFAKQFLIFMISHVGLTCLVVAYSIMGGFIFMELEATHELERRADIGNLRQFYVKKLWDITLNLNILYEANWTGSADLVFKDFQTDVYEAVKNTGWDGSDTVTSEVKEWTYAGALLYSVTVITTIGYGHLTPQTTWGRVVTMVYALVGIPLTLLCLTNIGSFMAKVFRLFWKEVLCRPCNKRRNSRGVVLHRKSTRDKKGLANRNDVTVTSPEVDHATDVVEYSTDRRDTVVRVPIVVCLFLLIGYIFLGAMLFTLWEPGWNYLEGSYFCFITLSTIGFGDYVPGHSHASWHDQAKRVSCTLYLLFGLALISMCFDLMQAEVREKCRDFARCLGISKSNPEPV